MHDPNICHGKAVNGIFEYLSGKISYAIYFIKGNDLNLPSSSNLKITNNLCVGHH